MTLNLVLNLDVEAVEVHDLGPSSNEILDKLVLGISATVNLRNSTELGVGSEDQVGTGGSPLGRLGGTVGGSPELALAVLLAPLEVGGEEVDEKVVGQLALLLGEDTVGGSVEVGVEGAETTDQDGHLGGCEGQESGSVDKDLLGAGARSSVAVVAETIGKRLKVAELLEIGLLLGSINTAGSEGDLDALEASILGSLLNSGNTTEDNQVSQRDLLGLGLGVEVLLDGLEGGKNLLELLGVIAGPADLGLKSNAGTVSTTTLVGVAESRSRIPGGGNQLGNSKTIGGQDGGLEAGDIGLADGLTLLRGERILPDELLLRNLRTEVASVRAEITVEKLEPGLGEGLAHLLGVVEPALADLEVSGVVDEGEIAGEHGGAAELGLVERIRVVDGTVKGLPLVSSGGTLDEGPFVLEKTLEEVVAPPVKC